MKNKHNPCIILFTIAAMISMVSCSKNLVPQKPQLAYDDFKLDSLPVSECNIPIQVNLKPLYALAEKNIDTVFTSPDYPKDWVQEECATRYKYHFRRGPLQFRASGLSMDLAFTGYYQIIGSTRVCAGGTVLSPWTPACSCGFEEGERKVNVAFHNTITITPDYKINLSVQRKEPVAKDKCTVCFWGQDITAVVMNGLKKELDAASKAITDSFGVVDLKPKFSQVWNQLSEPFNLGGYGWLHINPTRFRINNIYAKNDSLNIFLGLSSRPVIRLDNKAAGSGALPDMGAMQLKNGFNIFLDAVLDYDSLSKLVTTQIQDKEFNFNKGPVKKLFIIKEIHLSGDHNEKLIIKVDFAGTDKGSIYLTGIPVYDSATRKMNIENLDFDVRTKDLLVKSAGWLFNRRIINEIKQYTVFDLGSYIDSSKTMVNQQLNRELVKGTWSSGQIDDIRLLGLYPLKNHLLIRTNLTGNFSIKVGSIDFSL